MLPGTLPSMALHRGLTAWNHFFAMGLPSWRMATTEGSLSTMPRRGRKSRCWRYRGQWPNRFRNIGGKAPEHSKIPFIHGMRASARRRRVRRVREGFFRAMTAKRAFAQRQDNTASPVNNPAQARTQQTYILVAPPFYFELHWPFRTLVVIANLARLNSTLAKKRAHAQTS